MKEFICVADREIFSVFGKSKIDVVRQFEHNNYGDYYVFTMKEFNERDIIKIENNEFVEYEKIVENDRDITGTYKLQQITYSIHKKNGEKILKASYNFKSSQGWVWTSKYLCFDREGVPRDIAIKWLSDRVNNEYAELKKMDNICTDDVHKKSEMFRKPTSVAIEMNDAGYPIVVKEFWGD